MDYILHGLVLQVCFGLDIPDAIVLLLSKYVRYILY